MSASVKRIVATADAPAPMTTAAPTYLQPARNTARSAGRRKGSVQSTRITCSPKTIVVADVVPLIVLGMIGSVPHIAAATAIRRTPGIAASRRIDPERSPEPCLDAAPIRRDAAGMADPMPAIRYARSGEVHVAYQVVGDGPVDIVFVEGSFTNRHVQWEAPLYRRFVERLSSFARVILFDKRGMGLSDRVQAGTLEERMEDVRAVMDAAGSERAALIGESEGGPMSMLFAASFPERTVALLLCGAEVKEDKTDDWPWGESTREEFEESMSTLSERWSRRPASLSAFIPSRGDDPALLDWYARLKVQSASPAAAEAFMRMAHDIDVRDVAPAIRVPTLILHSAGEQVCHVEHARFLARTIPDARYLELPGADHVMFGELADPALAEIREFLTGVLEAPDPDRVLATVLFTDLVGSTEQAREV